MAELLGTPFGLNLETKDVDHLFYNKFKKKLGYWSTMKLSLADKAAIYNQVLISTLWFILSYGVAQTRFLVRLKETIRITFGRVKKNLSKHELVGMSVF